MQGRALAVVMWHLSNIYQKGATVTCGRPPMAALWSYREILWQLGAREAAPAMFLQTAFL